MSKSNGAAVDAGWTGFYGVKRHPGVFAWILSTDHKRIGILYLGAMLTFFLVGVALGFLIRLELIAPGKQIVEAQTYNAFFTLHGVIMIFLFVIPGLSASFGNFFLPLHLGARDVAFPKLNLLSWWLFITGGALAVTAMFTGSGPPDTGWTFYAPYSIRTGTNVVLAAFAVFVLGFSSILTGLNFITTVHRMRAPGMGWLRLTLFAWAVYATAWMQVLATPIVGVNLLLIIAERLFGIGVFDPAKGGDPILYQHLFWIYSHPAVYIMILPAMGAISEIMPVFTRRTIFGYKAIAFSSIAIAGFGSLVWGHHMFVSGQSYLAGAIFSFLTMLVAIPSAIKVFNWVATLYKGAIVFETPLLFAMSFIFLFTIGGLSGMMIGVLSFDVHVHDTYFILGHFHYVIFGGMGMAFFAALHYWFPKMFGRMYNTKTANASWLIIFIGFNLLYAPFFILGWEGMPRRYYDYLPQYHTLQLISTVGSWILISGLLLLIGNLLRSLKRGEPAPPNPWGGTTLEWSVPSPPPAENFEEIPVVDRDPYVYAEAQEP